MSNKVAVVIGASENSIHAINIARAYDIRVVAFDGDPKAEGFSYADERCCVDISDKEKTLQEVKKYHPDFVLPVPIGKCLSTIGYINEKLSLPGVGISATEKSTDKHLFHTVLHEKGLREINEYLINADTVRSKIKITMPVIVKPRYGSGSRAVYYVDNRQQLDSVLDEVIEQGEDFVLEEAVEGIEYGVDGAVIDGQFFLTLIRKKMITSLPERQAVSYISITNTEENQILIDQIEKFTLNVVQALEYQNCLMHMDLIVNGDNIFAIEAAPRPSGHNLHDIFVPMVTGIDMVEQYIRYVIGKKWNFIGNKNKYMQIRFFDFSQAMIQKVPELEELKRNTACRILKWECHLKEGDYLYSVTDGKSIMGRGYFIVEGTNEEDLLRQSEWILEQFKLKKRRIAIITARGGSKRIPKKNIKDFCGKPILAYSIEAAIESELFDEVMVSTDSEEIATVAEEFGASVPFLRSQDTADDFATTDDVLREVLTEYKRRGKEFDIVVCIYPTAPFVTAEKLREAVGLMTEGVDAVTPVVKFSFPPQRALIVRNSALEYQYPEYANTRSQDLEPIYHDCGQFYVQKPEVLLNKRKNIKKVPFICSELEVQDIDNEEDWKLAEMKYQMMHKGDEFYE